MSAAYPSHFMQRRTCLQAGSVLLASLCSPALAGVKNEIAPAFALLASDGQILLAEAPASKVTLIDFWASWCAPCRLSFPWMNAMHERWSGDGLRIVAVNLDRNDADARRFLQQNAPRFAIAMDPQALTGKAFGVQAMPTSLLIGPDRTIGLRHRGFRPEDRAVLEAQIQTMLGTPA